MFLHEFRERYLYHLRYDKDFKDIDTRVRRINQIVTLWGAHEEIENIGYEEIVRLKREMLERRCCARYINVYLQIIKSMLKFGQKLDLDVYDPAKIDYLPEPKKVIQYLKSEEIQKFLTFFKGEKIQDYRNQAIFSVLLDSGLRISECLSLNREQYGAISKGFTTIVGKGNKERLALFGWSISAVKQYLEKRHDDHTALFITHCADCRWKDGRLKPDGVREYLRIYNKKFGTNITPHTLRRTAITNWHKNGMMLKDVSLIAGHTSVKTTEQFYLGIDWEKLKNSHKKYSYLGCG